MLDLLRNFYNFYKDLYMDLYKDLYMEECREYLRTVHSFKFY